MRSASVSLASRDLSAPLDPASSAFSLAFASALPRSVVAASACAWSRTRSFSLRNALFFARHSRLWLSSIPFAAAHASGQSPQVAHARLDGPRRLRVPRGELLERSRARVRAAHVCFVRVLAHPFARAHGGFEFVFGVFKRLRVRDLISSRAVSNRARRRTKKRSCAFSIASRTSSISLLCLACFSSISSRSFSKASATSPRIRREMIGGFRARFACNRNNVSTRAT